MYRQITRKWLLLLTPIMLAFHHTKAMAGWLGDWHLTAHHILPTRNHNYIVTDNVQQQKNINSFISILTSESIFLLNLLLSTECTVNRDVHDTF